MLLEKMNATFGRLENASLELGRGLNIICAPNEAGKSTWCAFLRAMLYGFPSRERGPLAERSRSQPWSGAAMEGRIDCCHEGRAITLLRRTGRAGAPMGEFAAVYRDTSQSVPGLTAANCGEVLLGVPREVFERSAFIRQGGMAVDQNEELERRIAALLSAGQEDTSYTEAAARLRRQRTRRRHNKTGLLPELEAQAAETRRRRSEAQALEQQLTSDREEATALLRRRAELTEALAEADRHDAAQRQLSAQQAAETAQAAQARADALRRALEADRIPENETIARLRGALINLETTRKAVEKARAQRDEAAKALLRAEEAANESPFAPQTAATARQEVQKPLTAWRNSRSAAGETVVLLAALVLAALCLAALPLARELLTTPLLKALPWIGAVAVAGAGWYVSRLCRRRAMEKARDAAWQKRFGTADPASIAALAEDYDALLTARDEAQAELDRRAAQADALYNTLYANEQALLLEIRRFAPEAFDARTADELLRRCALRRKALSEAEAAAREARLRRELTASAPAGAAVPPSNTAPAPDRAALRAELDSVNEALTAVRSRADQTQGRLSALGDQGSLQRELQRQEAEIAQLQGEYDAITLALEVLEEADGEMQSRFSPALSRRAGAIFATLTGGRYQTLALDRELHAAAQPQGDPQLRDGRLLSQGTADQLYLAVRLAVCESVLPPEKEVPLILDDALAAFDDDRCEAALEYLRTCGRQVLLFTCHSREARMTAGKPGVTVTRL